MSETTRLAVAIYTALGFKTPPIKIYSQPSQFGYEWRCDIDHGIGYHGFGKSPAEALMRAADAWREYFEGEPS